MCLYVLSFVLWCPLRFPHKVNVQFVFTSIYLLFTLCVFVCAQWCPKHFVLCFCLLAFVLCIFVIASSVFSNVYFVWLCCLDKCKGFYYPVNFCHYTSNECCSMHLFSSSYFCFRINTDIFCLDIKLLEKSKQFLTPLSTAITSYYLIAAFVF